MSLITKKRLVQTLANTKKNRKNNFLSHAFILLTSPRNRIPCGSAGDSIHEKIFQKHLWKISDCDFRNQFCKLPPVRGWGVLPSICQIHFPCHSDNFTN